MSEHPQFDEGLDLYALGVLEPGERDAIDAHIRGCAECEREIDDAHGLLALLALAAPQQDAPPNARVRLLQLARSHPIRREASTRIARLPRWTTAIAAVAVIAFAVLYALSLRENSSLKTQIHQLQAQHTHLQDQAQRAEAVLAVLTAADTVQVTLVKTSTTPVPQGRAFYNAHRGLLFYAGNMPAVPPGKTYELWLIPTQGSPIPAGTFNPDARGNGKILLPPLPPGIQPKTFALTIEPAGGLPQPSGSPVLVGSAS